MATHRDVHNPTLSYLHTCGFKVVKNMSSGLRSPPSESSSTLRVVWTVPATSDRLADTVCPAGRDQLSPGVRSEVIGVDDVDGVVVVVVVGIDGYLIP